MWLGPEEEMLSSCLWGCFWEVCAAVRHEELMLADPPHIPVIFFSPTDGLKVGLDDLSNLP